jgi:putative DNA primase/helicase
MSADIPYGRDYPDQPWIDRDGEPMDDGKPVEVHRGQARLAYRVADRYSGQMLHVTGLGWHQWDGNRFIVDDKGAATRSVLAELRRALAASLDDKELRADVRKCESATGVAGVLSLASALDPFAAAVNDLDADPHLLNVANGTLDLRTLELHPHSAVDRMTKVCRGAYDPDAKSDAWEAFLERVLPDEPVRRFMQRLIGVALLGAVREHVLAILTGTGANGKGTFYKAVCWAMGDYASTAEPDLFMHRDGAHPTGEMDLLGRRLIVVSESERDRRLAEATMKRLTGGDTIRARRMRQDFVEFTPSHTPLLITNHLPKVSGDDPAIWRRIRVVPFGVVIPEDERDGELDDRLQLAADAILSWAVAGWRDYTENGLQEPDAVLVATNDYQRSSDAIARFIEECCHVSPAVKSITSQVFEAWEKWRVADGAEQLSLKAFGLALTEKGYPLPKNPSGGKKWRPGIALRTNEDGDDDSG